VYIWRAAWTTTISHVAWKARDAGALVIFDCDDLMFRPELATAELIDAIRSGKYDAEKVANHYKGIRDAIHISDALTASTRPLAAAMREFYKPSFIIPNTFGLNDYLQAHSQRIPASRSASDGLLRIGYASGTLTHQRDFAQAAPGVAACLRKNPNTRLVLFRQTHQSMLDINEFPSFSGLEEQIEWRPFVSLAELSSEIARFDINLAPLEVGNPYVEAKSELKYFDAALVKVPTIASPTRPFRDAISHGLNGMLACNPEEWEQQIQTLVDDPGLRERLAHMAYLHVLAKFSPFTRIHAARSALNMLSTDKEKASLAFEGSLAKVNKSWAAPQCSVADLLLECASSAMPAAAVVMPLYNYADKVVEALDSVARQSLAPLELVIVDDASDDQSLDVVMAWSRENQNRFARLKVFRNQTNSGLGTTRNRAIAETDALFVLPLDADNIIDVDCLGELLKPLENSPAAFTYPFIRKFGESGDQLNIYDWHPMRFASGNYIDAMALINKCAWADVGGYDSERTGWEDYEFYCRLAEAGYWGIRVPAARAFYRVHGGSMVHTWTENSERRARIADRVRQRYPWIDLPGY
jgi:GT2 family glycosyltransferase/glycosyltransferase involved in cell wall biosynthesis